MSDCIFVNLKKHSVYCIPLPPSWNCFIYTKVYTVYVQYMFVLYVMHVSSSGWVPDVKLLSISLCPLKNLIKPVNSTWCTKLTKIIVDDFNHSSLQMTFTKRITDYTLISLLPNQVGKDIRCLLWVCEECLEITLTVSPGLEECCVSSCSKILFFHKLVDFCFLYKKKIWAAKTVIKM